MLILLLYSCYEYERRILLASIRDIESSILGGNESKIKTLLHGNDNLSYLSANPAKWSNTLN